MNAADFYVVPGLKRLCEQWLVETLNTTNMVDRYDSLFLVCLFLEFHHTGSSWEIHTTQWAWGTLRRRCCWPTPRSLTWSQTGGRSCQPGLSLLLRCSVSLLGTLCEISVTFGDLFWKSDARVLWLFHYMYHFLSLYTVLPDPCPNKRKYWKLDLIVPKILTCLLVAIKELFVKVESLKWVPQERNCSFI